MSLRTGHARRRRGSAYPPRDYAVPQADSDIESLPRCAPAPRIGVCQAFAQPAAGAARARAARARLPPGRLGRHARGSARRVPRPPRLRAPRRAACVYATQARETRPVAAVFGYAGPARKAQLGPSGEDPFTDDRGGPHSAGRRRQWRWPVCWNRWRELARACATSRQIVSWQRPSDLSPCRAAPSTVRRALRWPSSPSRIALDRGA